MECVLIYLEHVQAQEIGEIFKLRGVDYYFNNLTNCFI